MESRLSDKLAQANQTDTFSVRYLCPSCASAKRLKDQTVVMAIYAGVSVAGLVLICIDRELAPGWLLLNLFVFQLSLVLTIVPHELGHALMARAVGLEVFDVIIGFGRKLWTGTVAGIPITVNCVPVGGLTR